MIPATEFYLKAKDAIEKEGYGGEIEYVERIKELKQQTPEAFLREYVWVVLNAGMKEQVARKIFDKFWECVRGDSLLIQEDVNPFRVIGHPEKRKSIEEAVREHKRWFKELLAAEDKIEYLESLPFIGPITKHHLARNVGIDAVKPDRHLQRLAEKFGFPSPLEMCKAIQVELIDGQGPPEKLGTIDLVLWRYSNLFGS